MISQNERLSSLSGSVYGSGYFPCSHLFIILPLIDPVNSIYCRVLEEADLSRHQIKRLQQSNHPSRPLLRAWHRNSFLWAWSRMCNKFSGSGLNGHCSSVEFDVLS